MSDPRDDLAALAADILRREYVGGVDEIMRFVAEDYIPAIIARWRLVPVEEACADTSWPVHKPMSIPRDCQTCLDQYAAQHRAADELTRHDQDAGIYRDDLAAGLYIPPKLRTDNHGPHED